MKNEPVWTKEKVVVDKKYNTTAKRDGEGRILVDDAAEIEGERQALLDRKAAEEAALKTPEGLYNHRMRELQEKLKILGENVVQDAWCSYCRYGTEIFKEIFSPDEDQEQKSKDRLGMGDDTGGALRAIQHGFEESCDDMSWLLAGHMEPGQE